MNSNSISRWLGTFAAAALAFGLAAAPPATSADAAGLNFLTIDNPADSNFNQLLGVNNALEIVGYSGDGSIKPNKGYLVVPIDHFSGENFLKSVQTEVTGINNLRVPITVGFWIDSRGNNIGFVNARGNFTSVVDPNTGAVGGVQINQLLGVNSSGQAVGFYIDKNADPHGYMYDVNTQSFQELNLPFANVVSFQATGINDDGIICSSYSNGSVTSGFYGSNGSFTSVSYDKSTDTAILGINNSGRTAGSLS
jgi:hypothetical protein